MIPFIHVNEFQVGPLPLQPFGILVAIGVIVGSALAERRARRLGLDSKHFSSFLRWMLVGGFVCGHVLDSLFYHPEQVREAPWSLLYLWNGLSSFGGFVGALTGVVLWKFFETKPWVALGSSWVLVRPVRRSAPMPILPFCDVVLAVFPVAWIFGRLGCSVVHDHPGLAVSKPTPFTVAFGPGPVHSYGFFTLTAGSHPRYDLGLLELCFTVMIAAAFAMTWKKSRPVGFYAAALPLLYAPIRFGLDYLRLEDAEGGDLRYAALTPAQWGCLALFGLGVVLAVRFARVSSRLAAAS